MFLRIQQRILNLTGMVGRSWSTEDNIPEWWKSKARGADQTDMQGNTVISMEKFMSFAS